MKLQLSLTLGTSLLASVLLAQAEIKLVIEHNPNESATAQFKFKSVPAPSKRDAASKATLTLVDGEKDANSGELEKLNDGNLPSEEDQPAETFFFDAGAGGGRVLMDLGSEIAVKQVNTYSWHPGTRGPQVYKLYGSDGSAGDFNSKPRKGTDPEKCGWKLVASVDARPKEGEPGGQYGVSISDSEGAIGKYRYLLFDISRTESSDPFGNTFFCELDVIDQKAPAAAEAAPAQPGKEIVEIEDGKYQATIDTTETPDLTEWAHTKVVPMIVEWYPKLVQMLPSEGFEAPKRFSVFFSKDMSGVANTGGTRIRCAAPWFRQNLKGEALGAIFHEVVHVVQQYGGARRLSPGATRAPGWLTEGIPDYLRWYKFEPQAHGADITRRNLSRARYDGSYRPTANFLNWVTTQYAVDLVPRLNAAIREGRYNAELWTKLAGKPAPELGDDWKKALEKELAAQPATEDPAKVNALTRTETRAGWKLLFNGKDLEGWHNFKRQDVRPGWEVKDATLACVDPHNAGDLCTQDQYDWFELQLDYNISEGGNSGIMFHVTDQGGASWATGPEFQLEDNAKAADPQRCGWLYALYQPPTDPATGKPLDATKPAGQWNHVRLLISPEKCEHEINGVKYFEYVLGSEDFNGRVAKSKFGRMPLFAKFDKGYVALQGDHGQVSFRNIKIRPIEAKK